MTRQEAIQHIESLYPIDSEYEDTNAIGEILLAQAKREVNNWRNLPDAILIRYAELCINEENSGTQTAAFRMKGRIK